MIKDIQLQYKRDMGISHQKEVDFHLGKRKEKSVNHIRATLTKEEIADYLEDDYISLRFASPEYQEYLEEKVEEQESEITDLKERIKFLEDEVETVDRMRAELAKDLEDYKSLV